MKILIINVQIGKGSVGQIVRDIYDGIIASGNECKIAYARGNSGTVPECDTIKIGNKIDQLFHALFSRLFGKTATYSKLVTKRFIKEIEKFSPDIISIHGVYGYYINMPLLYRYISEHDIHLYSTLHSCWDFTGHCCYFDFVNCKEWMKDCKTCTQKNSYPSCYFFDRTNDNLQMKSHLYHLIKNCTIITPSLWMESLVKDSILKDIKTMTIHNGIDLSVFKKVDSVNSFGKPLVLCVASIWEARKGLNDIIELSNIAKDRIQIVIVGLDDKQLKKIPNRIIGIKRTNNISELVSLYSAATVFFNPTYEDNYPTVNLEAIGCHTPVITYNTGGCIETINEGKYGSIVNRKDFNSVLSLIDDYYNNRIEIDYSDLSYISKNNMVDTYVNAFINREG